MRRRYCCKETCAGPITVQHDMHTIPKICGLLNFYMHHPNFIQDVENELKIF